MRSKTKRIWDYVHSIHDKSQIGNRDLVFYCIEVRSLEALFCKRQTLDGRQQKVFNVPCLS
jgi:hypothetical protein